jgi:hypothetical protein
MKHIYAISSINEAVKHLFVVSTMEHQEKSSKENSSRIEEKRILGEKCELLYAKERNVLGMFRGFPNIVCSYIL